MKAFSPEFQENAQIVEQNYRAALLKSESFASVATSPALLARAELLRRTGASTQARVVLESLNRPNDQPRDLGWRSWSKGNLARQLGELDNAMKEYRAAQQYARTAKDSVLSFYARAGQAESNRIKGRFDVAVVQHQRLLLEANSSRDIRAIVWALQGIAQIARNTGHVIDAKRIFNQTALLAERSGDVRGLGYALRGLGDTSSLLGDHRTGLSHIRAAREIFSRSGAVQSLAYTAKAESDVLLRLGELDAAVDICSEAVGLFERSGDVRGISFMTLNQARIGLAKCDWEWASISLLSAASAFGASHVSHGIARLDLVRKSFEAARPSIYVHFTKASPLGVVA